MTNMKSILGGAVWMAVASVLMAAALEPTPSDLTETQYAAVKLVVGFAEI